jgi:hypothetical protein
MDNFKKDSNSDPEAGWTEDLSNIPITSTSLNVFDAIGNNLGEIKQILGDHSKDIDFAIFQFREDLGLGKKSYVIPWNIFQNHSSGAFLVLDKDFNFIRNAPSFHSNNWPDQINEYLKDVRRYWQE